MAPEQKVTVLFADVVGSTQLYETLGDEQARDTVRQCLQVMRKATEQFGGSVIKTMGDEVMSTFPSADDAINAATLMQQRITNRASFGAEGEHVAIRVGCHYGPVVVDERDVFGSSVHTANRMTSQAKAGQILTTAATVEQLSSQWRMLVRQIDVATPRGQSDEIAVFEVLWQPEEATSMLPSLELHARQRGAARRVLLRFRDEEIRLEEGGQTSATMGRADDNDVVVKGNLISRLHARIEFVRQRFVLVDESTNGTFIRKDDGEEVYVRRDTAELSGSGVICMGRLASRGTPMAIEYRVETD